MLKHLNKIRKLIRELIYKMYKTTQYIAKKKFVDEKNAKTEKIFVDGTDGTYCILELEWCY